MMERKRSVSNLLNFLSIRRSNITKPGEVFQMNQLMEHLRMFVEIMCKFL